MHASVRYLHRRIERTHLPGERERREFGVAICRVSCWWFWWWCGDVVGGLVAAPRPMRSRVYVSITRHRHRLSSISGIAIGIHVPCRAYAEHNSPLLQLLLPLRLVQECTRSCVSSLCLCACVILCVCANNRVIKLLASERVCVVCTMTPMGALLYRVFISKYRII